MARTLRHIKRHRKKHKIKTNKKTETKSKTNTKTETWILAETTIETKTFIMTKTRDKDIDIAIDATTTYSACMWQSWNPVSHSLVVTFLSVQIRGPGGGVRLHYIL